MFNICHLVVTSIVNKGFSLSFTKRPYLLCAYIRYSMFYFLYLDVYFIFFDFTVAHGDRKYYYVKVVESIQFVCSGISGSCRDASAVNTYRSTVYDLFVISAYVPMFAYPLDSPYYLNCFCSLHST